MAAAAAKAEHSSRSSDYARVALTLADGSISFALLQCTSYKRLDTCEWKDMLFAYGLTNLCVCCCCHAVLLPLCCAAAAASLMACAVQHPHGAE
jgi:hypothetical protein